MAGRVYFISSEYIDDNGDRVIQNYDTRAEWYMAKYFCEARISFLKEQALLEGWDLMEENNPVCEERCFCGLYRAKLLEAVLGLKPKRAWKLFYYGFVRMVKDKKNGL